MLERKAVQKFFRCFSLEDMFVQEGKSHLGRRGYKVVQTRFRGRKNRCAGCVVHGVGFGTLR